MQIINSVTTWKSTIFTVFCLLFHIKKLTILNTNITFLISTLSNLRCLISGSNIILNNNSFIISQLEFISYILTIHFFSYTFLYWLMCKLVLTKFVIFFYVLVLQISGRSWQQQNRPPVSSTLSFKLLRLDSLWMTRAWALKLFRGWREYEYNIAFGQQRQNAS